MEYAHRHNLVDKDRAGQDRPWGIRVTLPPSDPFNNLVDAGWEKTHWYATERERDEALEHMRTRHGYYRIGDEVSLIFEKVGKQT
jgi:hypothetical protein